MSNPKPPDVVQILELMLGDNWELWLKQQARVPSDLSLPKAIASSGKGLCVGREVVPGDAISSNLYGSQLLDDVLEVDDDSSLGRQARGAIAV